MTNTKIVATLGPATDQTDTLKRLLEAGVDVARLNASHGTPEDIKRRIEMVRDEAARLGHHTGILLDLQGPKIRLGTFTGGRAELQKGADFTITTEKVEGNASLACTTYTDFAKDVKGGDRVLLADGSVELEVMDSD